MYIVIYNVYSKHGLETNKIDQLNFNLLAYYISAMFEVFAIVKFNQT